MFTFGWGAVPPENMGSEYIKNDKNQQIEKLKTISPLSITHIPENCEYWYILWILNIDIENCEYWILIYTHSYISKLNIDI